MTCSAKGADAGLIFESWSGDPKGSGNSHLICTINDRDSSRHFVEVSNRKTIRRTLWVRGLITSHANRARFAVPPAATETEWAECEVLYESGAGLDDTRTFGGVPVLKKAAGREYIGIAVEYQNHWPNSVKKHAKTAAVIFGLDVT